MSGAPAPYACRAAAPGARQHPEAPSPDRTAFQRDRDRILHSTAFRRLALKTQVFMPGVDDHCRTRLTHSLEVAQIARSLARALALDEDLAEALALAHDLGHGPFGHTGEEALDEVIAPWEGFDHNVQSLRIVVDLEQRYLAFDGLNLTLDTLEGLAKRNGPVAAPPPLLRAYDRRLGLDLRRFPSAEAQVAALADDIAYNAHDIEDGLRTALLALDDLEAQPFLRAILDDLRTSHPAADRHRLPYALARRLIDLFARDALAESRRRLAAARPDSVAAVRALDAPVAALSAPMASASAALKAFLFARLYRHPRLMETRAQARRLVADLAGLFLAEPQRMAGEWGAAVPAGEGAMAARARRVCDYVAGMTDRRAIAEHRRFFDATPDFA